MRASLPRSWLMASTGAVALVAGPAAAQQDSECARGLDQLQEQLQQADVAEERRADVQLVIDGTRTLADTGDEQGCERVSAELDRLIQTVAGSGAATAQPQGGEPTQGDQPQNDPTPQAKEQIQTEGAEQPQADAAGAETTQPPQERPAAQIAGQGDVPTPDHQVRQAIDEAQMALQQDDGEAARSALDDAEQNLRLVAEQAGDDAPPQLDEVEQSIQQARAALEQDEVQTAQQALEDAKVPMQEAMLQPATREGQQGGSPLAEIPPGNLLGQDVVNPEGETVAEIVDVVKQANADDLFAVLSVGGFFGLGEKQVAMPLERFAVGQNDAIILRNATEDELKDMPPYEDDGSFQSVSP